MPVYKNVLAPSVNQNHPDELKETPESGTNHLVYMIDPANLYKMCETYHFYFTSTGATNYPCLITIGALSATTSCTIGDYVIEWHLNSIEGSVVLTSGVGTDPNYPGMVQIPFTNQPVPGGVLYPMIVYIYVNGDKYTSYPDPNARYSPDLKTCINPISVFDLNCNNGSQGSITPPSPYNSTYTHAISYNYTTSQPNQASRELSFVLNTGGTTKYFCWFFNGYYYADKVKVSYIRKSDMYETILDYWNIGTTATPTDFTSTPKKWGGQMFQFVTNLTGITYNNGDYLKINITPNESNPLTNWDIYFKCKGDFNCITAPIGWNYPDTGTTSMVSGTTSGQCYYRLTFNSLSGYNWTLSDFYKYYVYNTNTMYGSGSASYTPATDSISCTLYIYTGHTLYSVPGMNTSCTVYSDIYTISKTGNLLTFTFNSSTDYNTYKSSFDTIFNNTGMSGYTSDNTKFNHYKFFYVYMRSGTTCGDGQTERYLYFHYSSPITWDEPNKTFSITLTNTTNGITETNCNTAHSTIDSYISIVTSSINLPDYTWSSIKLGGASPFGGISMFETPNIYYNETEKEFYWYILAYPDIVNNVCSLTGWYTSGWYTSGGYSYLYKCRVKIKITNTSDPVNNYELYHGLDSNGAPTTYTLIYSKP